MKKRLTKQQKENQLKAALLQRVADIYSGAQGAEWDDDAFATAEVLSRVMPVLREIFDPKEEKLWIFNHHCLNYFDTAETATDHLFSYGIRA